MSNESKPPAAPNRKESPRLLRHLEKWKPAYDILATFGVLFAICFGGVSTCQNQKAIQQTQTSFQFHVEQATAPLEGNIRCRFSNLNNYFDIEGFNATSWRKAGRASTNAYVFQAKQDVRDFAMAFQKLKRDKESVWYDTPLLILDGEQTAGGYEVQLKELAQQTEKIRAEFVERMRHANRFTIREEDGHITLSFIAQIHNPRSTASWVRSIRYDMSQVKAKFGERILMMMPTPCVQPELYSVDSSRRIAPRPTPFALGPGEDIVLLISFRVHPGVLTLACSQDEDNKDDALNMLLSAFYHMGIRLNEKAISNNETWLLPESYVKDSGYPWYTDCVGIP